MRLGTTATPYARPNRRLQLSIFAGGVAGALARAGLVQWFPNDGRSWPWATFGVNVVGTALLGFLATWLQGRPRSPHLPMLLGAGFCATFTTFSTFQLEVIKLVRHGHAALAIGYVVASVAIGLTVVYLATALARRRSRPA